MAPIGLTRQSSATALGPGCAAVERTLTKVDIDAQRQRAVGWSDWLGCISRIASRLQSSFALLHPCVGRKGQYRDQPSRLQWTVPVPKRNLQGLVLSHL